VLVLCLALPVIGCASPKAPASVTPQAMAAPGISGTIAAIRPVTSSQDPTGALKQIMSILSQSAVPAVSASEIVMRLPDDTIKTSVQPAPAPLAPGSRAAITAGPDTAIQPY
jgi:hypothetical protein